MISQLSVALTWVSVAAGILNLALGALKRKPSLVSLSGVAIVELALLVQLVSSIALLIQGQTSKGNIFEFFGYVLVALVVPVAAALWSLVERTRQSTVILGIAPLVICVMVARMNTIWFG